MPTRTMGKSVLHIPEALGEPIEAVGCFVDVDTDAGRVLMMYYTAGRPLTREVETHGEVVAQVVLSLDEFYAMAKGWPLYADKLREAMEAKKQAPPK